LQLLYVAPNKKHWRIIQRAARTKWFPTAKPPAGKIPLYTHAGACAGAHVYILGIAKEQIIAEHSNGGALPQLWVLAR
jgi:hypothetical protein